MEKALILNLSGGGMRMSVTDCFTPGEKIIINLFIDDVKLLVTGKVVREIERRGNSQIYGVQFVDIQDFARDKIIKKVFSHMRKQIEVV
jgi:c-di-GMP-binding flagellar brake protein YcgR